MPEEHSESILSRMFVVFGVILLVPFAIGMQLFRINFWEGSSLRRLWNQQTIDNVSIPARRGNIYDENGSLLVTNSVAYKIALDPKIQGLKKSEIKQVCDTLGKYSAKSNWYYRSKINRAPAQSRYVVLSKNANAEADDALRKLDLRALILEEQYDRRYNYQSLAAHVLGFVNHNLQGMAGLEKSYNKQLSGDDGLQQVRRERNGDISAYVGAPQKLPEQGKSLYTTIDAHIQAILEEELKDGIKRTNAKNGTAIVLDPRTGAVKAMANYPTFNPNFPASLGKNNQRNFATSDMIEPGSTFKLVTAIAAVERHKVNFQEKITTPKNGKRKIHGQWMRDHEPLGNMTFPEVIQKSSNVATSKIAMRLSNDTFYQYARNLGFGTPTNIDLPDEETGKLPKPYTWSDVSLPWMSIGYELQVTPIQLAQAYAALANGGKMMRPYLVRKIVDGHGNSVWKHHNTEVRRVAKKSTIKKLIPVFKGVVSDSGTAEQAKVKGLTIAGKTGTAQKLINGRYRNKYHSTFVGFFPADNPKYLCLVMLDDPETYPPYGGWTAGPIFQKTAKRIAGLDNEIEKKILAGEAPDSIWAYAPKLTGLSKTNAKAVLQNQHLAYLIKGKGNEVAKQEPAAGTSLQKGDQITLQLTTLKSPNDTLKNYAEIPDLGGMSMREANDLVNSRGFELKMIGSGTIYRQFPRAGDQMKKGRTVTVRGKTEALTKLTAE